MTTLAIAHLAPDPDSLDIIIKDRQAVGTVVLDLPHLQNDVEIAFTATFAIDGEYRENWDYFGNYKSHYYEMCICDVQITAWEIVGLADETDTWTPTPEDQATIVDILVGLVESQEI